jgi:DMSO/TMAO reductase YedYZ molybdopterin-dependent catalytic subunit
MKTIHKPSPLLGALVGGLITAPVIALLFLADRIAGLPFIPFDLFDFASRNLPGVLLTFGIDTMVDVIITLNLGEVSTAAKTAEQLLGLGVFIVLGIVLGVLFFAVANRRTTPSRSVYNGVMLGFGVGFVLMLISSQVNLTATAPYLLQMTWVLLLFTGWGVTLNWIYNDLVQGDDADETVDAVDRRQFMVRIGGATATLTVVGAGLGTLWGNTSDEDGQLVAELPPEAPTETTTKPLPNQTPDNLSPAPGTRPEYTPLDNHYRIDISARPPVINASEWTLDVGGLVENPVSLTLQDLYEQFDRVDEYITMGCISNRIGGSLISTTKWSGFTMAQFLERVQPMPDAVAMKIVGADDFDEYLLLDVAMNDDRLMFAYEWDDQPLKQKHGFPLRVHIPDRYGMKQPKWIESIEFVDAWNEGYWVRRGWSREAMVNTVSVVDTVAINAIRQTDDGYVVPIGGMAWAGAKGIAKVEVSVDGGEWQEAQLRDPISDRTWVLWRYDWAFEEGTHEFAVRTYDGDGELQPMHIQGVRPDGATGVHALADTMPSSSTLEGA